MRGRPLALTDAKPSEARQPPASRVADDDRAARWHQISTVAAIWRLGTSADGLSAAEAARRLAVHGANVLEAARGRSALRILLGQFSDFMILLLLGAAIVSGLIGEGADAATIVAIVALNATVGFVQEHRAERALEALRSLAAPTAKVVRDGRAAVVPAAEVVPGDLVLLEAGGKVPADLRLVECVSLRVDEAALTGESVPVEKHLAPLDDADLGPGDRRNMAHAGTLVTQGRATGVAVATGMATEFGRIAALLEQTGETTTPLQRRLAELSRRLALAALAICGLVFVTGLMRGESAVFMFLTAVSLAVAAVPEALPAVVTISLALGARKMARKRALVRRLSAVETLGSVTFICADKTGTLTQNRMRVEAYSCDGVRAQAPERAVPWDELLTAMALCSDAEIGPAGSVIGDPTEAAIFSAAQQAGFEKATLARGYPRVAEWPFDPDRKRMTTLHSHPAGGFVSFTKGAPETVVPASALVRSAVGDSRLEAGVASGAGERMAAEGLRVLAVAMRRWPVRPERAELEDGLTLLGFVGLLDPPRDGAREAVETCRSAGIVPVMITGDHPATAAAVARSVGILGAGGSIVTGAEIARLGPDELERRAGTARVYARVAPEQKLAIVTALQRRGELVAMTGDGVNDAPALKKADIGVAMGRSGSDVAREASAMVLLDDDFTTIVGAVGEGRRIYDNVRKFVRYVVTTNSAEVWTIFLAPFLGLPIPLLPIHILWMNLVTDSLPGLALTAEPGEPDLMRRPPRPPREGVFARGLGVHVLWVGPLMAAVTLGLLAWSVRGGAAHWQTMVFTTLCLSQLANVLAIRSERESIFSQGLLSNRPLLGAVGLVFFLQMAVVYVPTLNGLFRTNPLSAGELGIALGASGVVFVAVELDKWRSRHVSARMGLAP